MYNIYKILNNKSNKIYIGKTTGTIEDRLKKHFSDAISGRLDTHLARSIRLYGKDAFVITLIDTANSVQELNEKEIYWIAFYDSYNNGYNETKGGDGGNTYSKKTPEEMQIIKNKISNSKKGGKNPNAKKIKIKNVETEEELHFNSAAEVQKFFNYNNHNFVTRRCNHTIRCLWQKKWAIAYEEDDYDVKATVEKGNRKSTHIQLIDLSTNEEYEFQSYAAAERYFGLKEKSISSKAYLKGEEFIYKNKYKIKVLN